MRDAFGGVFMIRLLLIILFIFVTFGAVSLNYAKAFRVKNKVIDYIEMNDIRDITNLENDTSLSKLLDKLNYNKQCDNGNGVSSLSYTGAVSSYCYNGIYIQILDVSDNKYLHYSVTTYADWNLGMLGNLLSFSGNTKAEPVRGTWKVTGEAKVTKKR